MRSLPPDDVGNLSFARRLAGWLVAYRLVAAGLFLAVVFAAWITLHPAPVDRSLDRMFATDHPAATAFRKTQDLFGGDQVVLLIYHDDQLLAKDRQGLERLKETVDQIHIKGSDVGVPGVASTLCLVDVDRLLSGEELLASLPMGLAGWGDASSLADDMFLTEGIVSDDPLAQRALDSFAGFTHSPDGKTAAIICVLEPENVASVSRDDTIAQLRTIADSRDSGALIGEPVMVVDGFRFVAEDGWRLTWWSTGLLALVIGLCFRSVRWMAIPLILVQAVLILVQSLVGLLGFHQTMVSSMLSAIVTVVGVAALMHFIVRFGELRRSGASHNSAWIETMTVLAFPAALACGTDAVGFISLCISGVAPVRDFGVMTAIASLLVLPAIYLLTPALALTGSIDRDPHAPWGRDILRQFLLTVSTWSQRHPMALLATLAGALVVGGVGMSQLEYETDFTKNFREDAELVRSYEMVETHFGGAGVWDVAIPAPDRLTNEYLAEAAAFENRLRSLQAGEGEAESARLSKVVGLPDVDGIVVALLDRATNRLNAGTPSLMKGFLKTAMVQVIDSPEERFQLMRNSLPEFLDALRSTKPDADGQHWLRISLRSPERASSASKLQLIQAVEAAAADYSTGDSYEAPARVSGIYILLATLVESLVVDQPYMFMYAMIGLFGLLWLAFRNPVLALFGVIPNVLPAVMILGVMGLAGWKVNMGAAMIAAVSMGLSIDSSVHYLTMFQRSLNRGLSSRAAISRAQKSVGQAAVLATLALIIGFSVLSVSNFVPTIYFGTLVSLAMLGGLVGNFVILPMLLALCYRQRVSET